MSGTARHILKRSITLLIRFFFDIIRLFASSAYRVFLWIYKRIRRHRIIRRYRKAVFELQHIDHPRRIVKQLWREQKRQHR